MIKSKDINIIINLIKIFLDRYTFRVMSDLFLKEVDKHIEVFFKSDDKTYLTNIVSEKIDFLVWKLIDKIDRDTFVMLAVEPDYRNKNIVLKCRERSFSKMYGLI